MKIPEQIRDALDATGLPYEVKPGKRHYKVYLSGRMCTVFSLSGRKHSPGLSSCAAAVAAIRRCAREILNQKGTP